MAKNISILEGRKARNFSRTKKLRTTKGNSTQDWIPEDEAGQYCDFETLEVTENGTYYASGCDGYDKVVINVGSGESRLIAKTITKNGQYNPADDNADGYSSVTVKAGAGGGDYTVKWEEKDNIKTAGGYSYTVIDNNLYYVADQDGKYYKYDGQSNIPLYYTDSIVDALINNNEELYAYIGRRPGNLYRGESFTLVENSTFPIYFCDPWNIIGYKGLILVLGLVNRVGASADPDYRIYGWNGSSWVIVGTLPVQSESKFSIIYKDELYVGFNNKEFWKYNGNNWTKLQDCPFNTTNLNMRAVAVFNIGDKERIHVATNNLHYSYNGEFWRPEEPISSVSILFNRNGEYGVSGYEMIPITEDSI